MSAIRDCLHGPVLLLLLGLACCWCSVLVLLLVLGHGPECKERAVRIDTPGCRLGGAARWRSGARCPDSASATRRSRQASCSATAAPLSPGSPPPTTCTPPAAAHSTAKGGAPHPPCIDGTKLDGACSNSVD